MGETEGDALDGPGWGEGDDIYDEVVFGAAHGGAYMSLGEAEGILELGAVIARTGAGPATVQGRGRMRWIPGPAGAAKGPVHEAGSFDRRIGPEGYVYLVPLEQFRDRTQSRRLTLQSLREKVAAYKVASAPALELELAFDCPGREDAPAAARLRIREADARAIRRAARAVRRSGALHAVVAATEGTPSSISQSGSPAIGLLDGARADWSAGPHPFAAELRVGAAEFWVWASGERWSDATERRPVSGLAERLGLRPL
jgi:hypothetical protein